VDVAYFAALTSDSSHSSSDNSGAFALAVLVAGLAVMYLSFRTYRYGEHYEYKRKLPGMSSGGMFNMQMPGSAKGILNVVRTLEKLQ
jgi:hypothetical protein